MRKILFKILAVTLLFNLSYSFSDYYRKVYTVKINKTELFNAIEANEKQQNSLNKIFDKYQKKAEDISGQPINYKQKVAKLNSLKNDRKEDIFKVLTHTQIKKYNTHINQKKAEFEERNEKIAELIESLNLSHTQKANILKHEGEFKRNIDKLSGENLSHEEFSAEYDKFKNTRNEKIRALLTDEQRTAVQNNNFL